MDKKLKILTGVVSYTLGFRLLSMLIIAPFLSVYAIELKGGTPALTGLALGVFGLTQAILQIPFGILSDKIGYKRMMIAGLIMLFTGLIVAGIAQNIYWLIFSRALQGSGAIVTVGYSWISAITTGNERDKALVKIGTLIATFSMLSYVLGPLVHIVLNVRHMFFFSAILIAGCILMVLFTTKEYEIDTSERVTEELPAASDTKSIKFGHILSSLLLTVNNLVTMAFFYVFPLILKDTLETSQMWMILVPSIIISILLQKFLAKVAVTKNTKWLLYLLFAIEGIAFFAMSRHKLWTISAGTPLLMIGSFSISTIVPLLLNRNNTKLQSRGKSNGIMVSFQYFGSFIGALITGILWNWSPVYSFVFIILMSVTGIILVRVNKYITVA